MKPRIEYKGIPASENVKAHGMQKCGNKNAGWNEMPTGRRTEGINIHRIDGNTRG